LGYRELNADAPDSGTSFTWATKAFGPYVGWLGGWGLVSVTVIVLSNLAGIAGIPSPPSRRGSRFPSSFTGVGMCA
jgi:amino acid transporter